MSNVAYTEKYRRRWDGHQRLFMSDNLREEQEHRVSDVYTVKVSEYAGEVDKLNLCGSECRLFDDSKKVIAEWRSIDNSSDFYTVIKHSNGRMYLIFRQDLYGYSLLDIEYRKIKQFFPEKSLDGGETFIWTNVGYNAELNVLAVSGCYWACPYNTHLFKFGDPMSDDLTYVDLIECFGGDYDIYDDVSFVKWVGGDLHVTRNVIETKTIEPVVIRQDEYLLWLSQKGQEL